MLNVFKDGNNFFGVFFWVEEDGASSPSGIFQRSIFSRISLVRGQGENDFIKGKKRKKDMNGIFHFIYSKILKVG